MKAPTNLKPPADATPAESPTTQFYYSGSTRKRWQEVARIFVLVVAALTFVWLVLRAIEGSQILGRMNEAGYIKTEIQQSDDVLVIHDPSARDFVGATVPEEGDTLLLINGQRATEELWEEVAAGQQPVGRDIQLTYLDDGLPRQAVARLRTMDAGIVTVLRVFFIAILLVALFYHGIGLLALIKQGHAAPARVLALFNMALAMFVAGLPTSIITGISFFQSALPPTGSFLLDAIGVLTIFATGYWLHLALIFPRPARVVRGRPWLLYAMCYGPGLMALPAEVTAGAMGQSLAESADGLMFIQFVAGLIVLWRGRKRAATQIERQQVRAVVMGVFLVPVLVLMPALLAALLAVFNVITSAPDTVILAAILFGVCLGLLPIPISFLYAFQRYRLMEVELRLRRGTRFALTAGFMLLIFFTLLFAVSSLALNTLGVDRPAGVLAIGLLLALALGPVQKQAHEFVQQKFFPERRGLQAMLKETLSASALLPDRAALWVHLEDGLRKALGVSAALPLLHDEDERGFTLAGGAVEAPFPATGPLGQALRRAGKPALADELLTNTRYGLMDDERRWLRDTRASILLPMVVHSRLVGFVALVFPAGHEDLAPEDLNVLTSVVSQFALQSEHLRLVEESVEKRRLAEQLEMAREVQQRFLPATLPAAAGLDLAVRFRSSLEVAGDYYDVLPLSGGRTLLVVADVSGKGAGAAMIMANVQASLRSMARANVPLLEMVTAMNDSLCANTSQDQFVTFFAAVFDPIDFSLTCVNAGHNPPRLVGSDGSVLELTTGGTVLGVLPEARFQAETLILQSGDVLVAFTDGVCEAMDGDGKEFGEDRIGELVTIQRRAQAEAIAATIERDVNSFHGSSAFEDDFTLLIAKVVERRDESGSRRDDESFALAER